MATFFPSSEPALRLMSVSELADCCTNEITKSRCGEKIYNEQYCLEMFRRAIVQRDPLAWELLQQRLHETMLRWMRFHPKREAACRLDSEENYVAQAFARFRRAATHDQEWEFSTLATVLACESQ